MEYIKLVDYCISVRDGTHDTPKPSDSGKYLVTSKAINNNAIDFGQCYKISETDYNKINKRSKVDVNDVLMTMIGTVGRLYLVKEEPDYAIKNIALFKIENELKAKWLYYYFSTKAIQNYFNIIATGTSQHFISLSHLRNLKIETMKEDADKIVSILSQYDALLENNNKRIKLLEQIAENLYKEWFVRFRFPNYKNWEFSNNIPNDWVVGKVGQYIKRLPFGKLYKDYELTGDGSVIVIDQSAADFVGYHNNAPSHYASNEKPIILFGDHTCKVKLMMRDFSLCENVVPFIALNNEQVDTVFLYFSTKKLIQTFEYKRHWTTFKNMKIIIPPMPLQREFSKKIVPFLNEAEKLFLINQNLIKQRDMLLPRLMSGKLQVK